MKSGIYFVKFNSNLADWGNGIITIQGDKVNGGDFAYFYQGEVKGSNIVLHVTQHDSKITSVFGAVKEFDLELSIQDFDSHLLLNGHVKGQPQLTIEIQARFLSNLI
ncbi:MAG: hypothetical protein [Caudoviricetes sp.]|nr:MAG: hypothetical protein [Caudoviricetes sp.]